MITIYKYSFNVNDSIKIKMPKGAKILDVQTQMNTPCIWVEVDTKQNIQETRHFYVFGTGHPIDVPMSSLDYIGTFQLENGHFIGHLYEG